MRQPGLKGISNSYVPLLEKARYWSPIVRVCVRPSAILSESELFYM